MVEQLQARVAGFVSQREDLVLVVRCTEADCALVTKSAGVCRGLRSGIYNQARGGAAHAAEAEPAAMASAASERR
jgi:hypothetical protein